jgi:mRNA interferase MazF
LARFSPGHRQRAGWKTAGAGAFTARFNELTGRCVACPITRRDRDWNFHVAITGIDDVQGVVQTDQLRSVSWEKRGSRFICMAPANVLDEVRAKLKPLLSL